MRVNKNFVTSPTDPWMTRIEHTLAGGQLWNAFHNRQLAVFRLRPLLSRVLVRCLVSLFRNRVDLWRPAFGRPIIPVAYSKSHFIKEN